jgi:MFS family permease
MSRVLGPALAGMITAVTGPAVCFLLNAAIYPAVIVSLLHIKPDPALVVPYRQPPPLREALAYLLAPGWPRTLVTLAAVYTIFGVSFLAVLPVYARDVLHAGASGYGWLTSAFGVGAAGGALLLAAYGARFRRGEFAIRSGFAIGGVLLILGLLPYYPLAFIGLVIGGMASATSAIVTNTLLQTEAPDQLRGRVIGFYSFIVVGLAPFGSLQAGWLGERVGVRIGAAACGIICLGTALVLVSRVKGLTQPVQGERLQADEPPGYRWGERRQT